MDLQQQLQLANLALEKLQKENQAYRRGASAVSGLVARNASEVQIPFGHTEAIKDYVKGPEIWRDVKFLSTDEETKDVCRLLIERMSQFSALDDQNPAVKDVNVQNFHAMYGGTVLSAVNSRRTDVTSALKKAYEKRFCAGKQMPSVAQLTMIILRQADMKKKPLPQDAQEIINEIQDAQDDTSRATFRSLLSRGHSEILNREDVAAILDYNDEVELNREFFEWYWNCLLPPVASKSRWGAAMRKHTTIIDGVFCQDKTKKLITDSDEAFVLIVYENCDKRFPYTARCKLNKIKPDETCDDYRVRWCSDAAGLQKFGSWTNAGRKRYVKWVRKIRTAKKNPDAIAMETDFLSSIAGAVATKRVEVGKEKERNEEDQFGGEAGKTAFVSLMSDDEDISDGEEELEPLGDQYMEVHENKKSRRCAV